MPPRPSALTDPIFTLADLLAFSENTSRQLSAAPVGTSWTWSLAFGHHEDRTPTHGYAATREAAMASFAKSWWRE